MRSSWLKAITLFSVLAITPLSHADWLGIDKKEALPQITLQSGLMLPKAKILHVFTNPETAQKTFTDQDGKPFGEANLEGHWTLVFFGFTNCPMLCPTTMAQLANAYQQLQKENFSPLPQVVFVSVDPERDNQAALKKFVNAFNPAFIGIRTSDQQLLGTFAHELNAAYEKVNSSGKDKDSKGTYTYTHTGDIAVINPDAKLVAMLTMPHKDGDIVADYKIIVKKLS
jgi:protein SCO1